VYAEKLAELGGPALGCTEGKERREKKNGSGSSWASHGKGKSRTDWACLGHCQASVEEGRASLAGLPARFLSKANLEYRKSVLNLHILFKL
jgi:hypothetical protein